jgi:TorA maturation chaperone TorD
MNTEAHRSSALDEEVARAEMYGLLAILYYQPAQLQAAVTEAPEQGGFLEEPWRDLVAQARAMTAPQIAQEFDSLFGGVGKPEVYLFGSHYLSGFLNEKPLVLLRDDLAALGLSRSEQMPETEDHLAYLLEVMRYLIAGDDVAVCNLSRQAEFFSRHLQPWLMAMAEAVMAHPRAAFYARLAALTQSFASVEAQGFDLL